MSRKMKKFSLDMRAWAVRLVLDQEGEHPSRRAGITSIATIWLLGTQAAGVGEEGRGEQRQAYRRSGRGSRPAEGVRTREPVVATN